MFRKEIQSRPSQRSGYRGNTWCRVAVVAYRRRRPQRFDDLWRRRTGRLDRRIHDPLGAQEGSQALKTPPRTPLHRGLRAPDRQLVSWCGRLSACSSSVRSMRSHALPSPTAVAVSCRPRRGPLGQQMGQHAPQTPADPSRSRSREIRLKLCFTYRPGLITRRSQVRILPPVLHESPAECGAFDVA
jgi:hypothetical protein